MADDLGGLDHAAGAGHARGEAAHRRAGDGYAPRPQRCDVMLRGRVVVHVAVHGGADDDGGAGSEHRGREGVVRQPVGDARYGVGGRGGNDHQVGALRDGHVVYTQLGARVEYVGYDRAMGDAAEGERRRELGRRLGHDDIDRCAVLGQLAGEVDGLVAGDAARDSQRYGLAL